MDAGEAFRIVNAHMERNYRKSLRDMDITETRGYWRAKEPCDPAKCHAPIHGTLFNKGPIQHTYSFSEHPMPRDANGRWVSPYRAWRLLYAAEHGEEQRISRDAMAFGCPVCGALFDRIEMQAMADKPRNQEITIARGPRFAFCTAGHRFRLDPDIKTPHNWPNGTVVSR